MGCIGIATGSFPQDDIYAAYAPAPGLIAAVRSYHDCYATVIRGLCYGILVYLPWCIFRYFITYDTICKGFIRNY